MQPTYSNHLIHESSPYLLQHAHNPVDWYPWGEAAFDKARREDKPILLSIGYSTCHWCHVMEEESFSDPEVGKVLNQDFVAIKVDREERPDIDQIYMRAAQLMTGSGGWPLTILMTPDRHPFFAATYMPKRTRFGRVGLIDVANRVHELWQNDRDQLLQSATKLTTMLNRLNSAGQKGGALQPDVIRNAYESLANRFDAVHGGFGNQPKFPSPHNLMFLLRYWHQHHDPHALTMVEKTLDGMRAGGIFDQLGGGFHRYSTDNHWLLPHFEKMLYDQAMLLMVYAEAYQATGKQRYAETARRIVDYVKRDLTAPNGAFYSAEDADSEGEEGKFYVWTQAEIEAALDKGDAEFAKRVFHIKAEGNVHDEATGQLTGANVLYVDGDKAETAKAMGMSESEFDQRLESVREKLLAVRNKRVRPFLDDKVLTDWNGLMIAALATAARALHEPEYAREARRAAAFLLKRMRTKSGGLLHRFRDGQAGIEGQLDDYAFLTWGLIELYETDFDTHDLQAALELNGYMLKHFDAQSGGLYSTADDAEKLLVRPIDPSDGALPSGNAIAMMNMLRLARLTGDAELEARAARIANAFAGEINGMPSAFCAMLSAFDFAEGTSYEVVLAGDRDSKDSEAMLKVIRSRFLPNKVVLWRPEGKAAEAVVKLAPFTAEQKPIDGKVTAYVCRNFQCNLPTTDPEKVLAMLAGDRSPR